MSKISVYIDGDRSIFKSKIGIDKFKIFIKENETFNLPDLSIKFLNDNNHFELVNKTETEIHIKIVKNEIIKDDKRQLLKNKLHNMANQRTNNKYPKPKSSEDAELFKEYDKINKMTKGQMPDLSQILKEPGEFKQALEVMLNNPMMDKLGNNHPLMKCYKLLGKKLGITKKDSYEINKSIVENKNDDTESEEDVPKLVASTNEELSKLVTSTNDEDTEDESE